MSEKNLKPCPFCGSKRLLFGRNLDGSIHSIFCRDCKASVRWLIEMGKRETFGDNEEKWAEKWNDRKGNEQNETNA